MSATSTATAEAKGEKSDKDDTAQQTPPHTHLLLARRIASPQGRLIFLQRRLRWQRFPKGKVRREPLKWQPSRRGDDFRNGEGQALAKTAEGVG
jgi:hypothetical protein